MKTKREFIPNHETVSQCGAKESVVQRVAENEIRAEIKVLFYYRYRQNARVSFVKKGKGVLTKALIKLTKAGICGCVRVVLF